MDRRETIDAEVSALAEYFGAVMTEKAVKGYREALIDVEPSKLVAACRRARKELEFMPKAAALRRFARDVVTESGPTELKCHFHGDGAGHGGFGRPNSQAQESYHWCVRCQVFIRHGSQPPDDGKHPRSGTRRLLEAMRADLGTAVMTPAEGMRAFIGQQMEREPGSDDIAPELPF